jgi:hypothetical protein
MLPVLDSTRFHLYGAGNQASNFLSDLDSCGIAADIKDILVTNIAGNPPYLRDIPVIQCDKSVLDKDDWIFLTVNDTLKTKIISYLDGCGATLFDSFPAIYHDVYNSIKPFIEGGMLLLPSSFCAVWLGACIRGGWPGAWPFCCLHEHTSPSCNFLPQYLQNMQPLLLRILCRTKSAHPARPRIVGHPEGSSLKSRGMDHI